ncbi:MAG: hypothetical protein HYX78_13910 [Armatimonadetes bacterium]|nr:hypothetical protein [Armatimonadota bacterium]
MNVDFEQAAEEFIQKIMKEHYLNGSGLKDTLEILPIYEVYGWIFERPTVTKALKRQDEEGRYVATFAADGYLDASVKELTEKVTNATTQATVEWQGEEIPYRRASVVIANEPDAGKRRDLESRVQARTEEMNPDRLERMQKLHGQAKDLGFGSYLQMYDQLKELHLDWLLGRMRELLDRTEDIFDAELDHHLDAIGMQKEDATPADTAYLFRAPQFDSLFPAEKLVESLKKTLSGMGIDLDSQKNVRLDTDSRPLKSPRAFCAPVVVPDEIYLVIAPRGGQDDYKAILHEAGHAEHFGHVLPDLPFAFKRLGDDAVSESFAFLMDNLLKNHRWFAEVMDTHGIDDYLRLTRFHKLWMTRRYAAKLNYEKLLHTASDIGAARNDYAQILRRILKINISDVNFLSDVDDGLYAAGYIRAWIFEVMLRKHLEDYFGALWFLNRGAGELLVEMWKDGQKYPVDVLAHRLHYERLDAEPLIQELAR